MKFLKKLKLRKQKYEISNKKYEILKNIWNF